MDKNLYTISAFTENSPGVLHRITVTFTKRKVNIESLTVCETETKGISRFTIVVKVEEDLIKTIVKQLNRVIEVKEVFAYLNKDLIYKEIAFIRVTTESAEEKLKVEELTNRYGGIVAYADSDSMVVEKTGTIDEILSLYELLEPFGVSEFVQSGRIAMAKNVKQFVVNA